MKMVQRKKYILKMNFRLFVSSVFTFLLLSHIYCINAQSAIPLKSVRLYPVLTDTEENKGLTWGYVAENGVWVIEPIYEGVQLEPEPLEWTPVGFLYPTKYKGKWGFLNVFGDWQIEPKYFAASHFRNGRALIVTFSGKRQLIDINENVYFSTDDQDLTFTLMSGGVSIIIEKDSNETIFIDKNGEVLFKKLDVQGYNAPSDHPYPQPTCSEGLIAIKENSSWGFLNKSGEWVIPPQYDDAQSFSEGLAAVKIKGKWGYIDHRGNWVLYPQFEKAHNFSEGLAGVMVNGKWIFTDKNGQAPFLSSFEPYQGIPRGTFYGMDYGAYTFYNGLAGAQSSNGHGWGYIDKTGNWYIPPRYIRAMRFVDGLAFVESGYVNLNGEKVVSFFHPNSKY